MDNQALIIIGHPRADSFCHSLAEAFRQGALSTSYSVDVIDLRELSFDPILHQGYKEKQELEPDLARAQELISQTKHLVFVYPTWWGAMPALLKGFIDRVFLPGYAFKYRKGSPFWDKLLRGRTAQLLVTMDSPPLYYRWVVRMPGHNQMKRTILGFCGIKTVKISSFGPVRGSSEKKRQQWIQKAKNLGSGVGPL